MGLRKRLIIPQQDVDLQMGFIEGELVQLVRQSGSLDRLDELLSQIRVFIYNHQTLEVINDLGDNYSLKTDHGAILVPKAWCKPVKKLSYY